MLVYRIAREKYASKLLSSGVANRWNDDGQFVIYAGSSRSLSSLELVVHRASIKPYLPYKVMVIELDVSFDQIKKINRRTLPDDWQSVSAYAELQQLGSKWYSSQDSLVVEVPSAIIPQESNYVINTKHPDFNKKVCIIDVEDYFWDRRLL